MKYSYFPATMLAGLLFLVLGCHSHNHPHGDDAHEPEGPEPLSFTIWTDKTELFVEFPPLTVGQESGFAAHFSRMDNFRAVKEGTAKIALLNGGNEVASHHADIPSSPGIFRLALTPSDAGQFRLAFYIATSGISDTIFIEDIEVYPTVEAAIAANPPQPEGGGISFLKEQAWKVDFGIAQAKRGSIHEVIRTSGEILPVKGEETVLSTNTSGIVFFKSNNLMEGREVRAGEILFTVNSKGLTEQNLEEKFLVAKARLEKARADLERSKPLLEQKIISQKKFDERKMEQAIAEAEFQTLAGSFKTGGVVFTAPFAGIIKRLPVSDGEFVQEGAPLVSLTRNRKLLLQGEVPQSQFSQLQNIRSANFKTPWQEQVHSIEDFNGRLVSYGKVTGEGGQFIPILFEVDNRGDLLAGSFVDLYLLTRPVEHALVLPKSALMQDYGQYYVYVQTEGESFEKREIKTGIDDGQRVQILSGLEEGEWVVTNGAYQIKMASMSSTIPAHGHSH